MIKARGSTVWDIIIDAGNYTVWDSGITHVTGEVRNGGTIRIRGFCVSTAVKAINTEGLWIKIGEAKQRAPPPIGSRLYLITAD